MFLVSAPDGLLGSASEVERQELKFLNLGWGKNAQDLLMQSARERRADVLLISNCNSKSPEWDEAHLDRRGI